MVIVWQAVAFCRDVLESLSNADLIGLRSVEAAERATECAVFHGRLGNIQEGNRWTNGRKMFVCRVNPGSHKDT